MQYNVGQSKQSLRGGALSFGVGDPWASHLQYETLSVSQLIYYIALAYVLHSHIWLHFPGQQTVSATHGGRKQKKQMLRGEQKEIQNFMSHSLLLCSAQPSLYYGDMLCVSPIHICIHSCPDKQLRLFVWTGESNKQHTESYNHLASRPPSTEDPQDPERSLMKRLYGIPSIITTQLKL